LLPLAHPFGKTGLFAFREASLFVGARVEARLQAVFIQFTFLRIVGQNIEPSNLFGERSAQSFGDRSRFFRRTAIPLRPRSAPSLLRPFSEDANGVEVELLFAVHQKVDFPQ
jgi:hypothetical protein